MPSSKDRQIKAIAAELDDLLASLQSTVDGLTEVLLPPPAEDSGAGKEAITS